MICIYYTDFCLKVGGVQFKPPACNNRVWGEMRRHHDLASKSKALRRGSTIEAFGYGSVHGFGSRQPQGGRAGDTYTEYPELSAITVEDIKTIFCYAYVSFSFLYMTYTDSYLGF